jgi:hypothetical protein
MIDEYKSDAHPETLTALQFWLTTAGKVSGNETTKPISADQAVTTGEP